MCKGLNVLFYILSVFIFIISSSVSWAFWKKPFVHEIIQLDGEELNLIKEQINKSFTETKYFRTLYINKTIYNYPYGGEGEISFEEAIKRERYIISKYDKDSNMLSFTEILNGKCNMYYLYNKDIKKKKVFVINIGCSEWKM